MKSTSKKILVFRIGSLGDCLVSLPSINALKINFPGAELFLLGSEFSGTSRVVGSELFKGSDLFRGFYIYPNPASLNYIQKLFFPFFLVKLWLNLKFINFDTVAYLAPSSRSKNQIKRDNFFFKSLGIKSILGMEGFSPFPEKLKEKPLPVIPSEGDLILKRLQASGLDISQANTGKTILTFQENERLSLKNLLTTLPSHGNRPLIAIGPSSNQPAKVWPKERYLEVVNELINKHDIWPVVFGGAEDKSIGEELILNWKRGYQFAGVLSIRLAALALKNCSLYLGNDTGTMHLAATVEVPCVAVFSSHNYPGRWFPRGSNHKIFYKHVDCEGCGLAECVEEKMKCIFATTTTEVYAACEALLK